MGGVFINYRGVDSGTAAALIDRELSSSLGSDRVFLDSRSILIGADFAGELLGRLRTCTVLLVVIGPRWLSVTGKSGMRRIDEAEDWIRLEVAEALRHGLRVVPVLTDQATLPRSDELPPDIAELSRRQYVRLRNRYTAVDLAELVRRIFEADPALGCGHPILPGDETRHQPLAAPNLPASRIGPAAVADTVVPPHAVEGEIHLRLSRAHVVPRQLPAEPTRFAGRNQELTMLTAALDGAPAIRATVPISAIGGAGGIGKTWLALRWAHRHLDWFPDGQLFVDLGGFAPAGPPMPPAVAVRGFLDALGVDPLAIPIDPDAQVGLYRSLVANRRMLIVLDNARDTAQIAPLLPGTATCTVLVTSRRHLAGLITNHGAEALTLDVLPEADARQLLATHLGFDRIVAEADAVTALLAYCAGLPLALSIVAARARHHPDFPLSLLAEELQDRATRLPAFDAGEISASLRTVFSASYEALTNDAAALFELLGLAPGPDISMAAAASLMGLPLARVQPLLRELEIAHLLTQPVPGRYRMHDLLHLYAAGQICQKRPADFVEDALRRLVDYYLNTSRSAGWLIDPFFSPALELAPPVHGCLPHSLADRAAALAWFDAEYACLLAILRQVSARGWNRAAWQLAMLIDIYFRRRGYLHDRLTTWQACLAAANQDADPAGVIHGHCALGDLSARLGKYDDALDHLHQALNLAQDTGSLLTQALTSLLLGGTWDLQGNQHQALDYVRTAIKMYQNLDRPVMEAYAGALLGWLLAKQGRYHDSRTHSQAALDVFRKYSYLHGEAGALDNLGYAAQCTGHYREAITYYQQALTKLKHDGDTFSEADTEDRLGQTYASLGDHDQARAAWQRALRLYRTQYRTADITRTQQRLDEVISWAQQRRLIG